MFKKAHYKALGIVGLLTVALVFCLPAQRVGRMKLAIGSFFLPLFGLSRTTSELVSDAGDTVTSRRELLKEIEQLKRTNQALRIHQMQAEAIFRENERLNQQVKWQSTTLWKDRLKLAHVIARDPANWWQIIHIDLGSRNGIREDLPVLTDAGLVGRVLSVSLTHSEVVLISNPGCKVSAVVDKTKEMGVITGSASPVNNTVVTMSYLASNSSLRPGQLVLTSGAGRIFPAGIPVGQVADTPRSVDFGRSTEARVKLAADLGTLSEVWVLMMP